MADITFVASGRRSLIGERGQRAGRRGITFGREEVLVGAAPSEAQGGRTRSAPGGTRLAAVVQKGRLFQKAYPKVPVLGDRGRYLIVALEPDHPALRAPADEPCFAVYPVEPGDTVFEEVNAQPMRLARDPDVAAVLERLSQRTFRASIEELAALHTRLSPTDFFRQATALCRGRLVACGYDVAVQDFEMRGGSSCNLLALPASGAPVRALVVAHLDSVNHPGGPEAQAPGADDNASGSAGVVVMAEALVPVLERMPIGFVLFGGEEQGLFGSRHFVGALPGEKSAALRAIINMDMIGCVNLPPDALSERPGVLLEGAEISRAVIEGLAVQAASWTELDVQVSFNPFASDHVPFIEAGLPALLTIEGADQSNTNIHGPNDTLDVIDDAFALSILRMNTAYLASLARDG